MDRAPKKPPRLRTRHRYKALIADSAAEVNALMVTVGLPGVVDQQSDIESTNIPSLCHVLETLPLADVVPDTTFVATPEMRTVVALFIDTLVGGDTKWKEAWKTLISGSGTAHLNSYRRDIVRQLVTILLANRHKLQQMLKELKSEEKWKR